MPSFDVVSDFATHEATNAVDQANREVTTRFDFKGTGSIYELDGAQILLSRAQFKVSKGSSGNIPTSLLTKWGRFSPQT